ncbi:MAG: hypothetical protein ACFCVF_16095 [Kineosporiaceae bacterium]
MSRKLRRIAVSSVAALGLGLSLAVTNATAAQAALPVPNSCAKNNFAEWHDGYPTYFSFQRAYKVRTSATTVTTYHDYLVGYYSIQGPFPYGAVTKVCGRERPL